MNKKIVKISLVWIFCKKLSLKNLEFKNNVKNLYCLFEKEVNFVVKKNCYVFWYSFVNNYILCYLLFNVNRWKNSWFIFIYVI